MENEVLTQLIKEADALYADGRIDAALDAYTAILEQDASVAWAHSRIGAIQAQRENLDAAEQSLTRALELDPELPQARSNLGNIHYSRGQYEKAVECYQAAAQLDPTNPLYHENLHAAYKKLNRVADAVKALKHSHKLVRELSTQQTKAEVQNVKRKMGCVSVFVVLALLISATTAVVSII